MTMLMMIMMIMVQTIVADCWHPDYSLRKRPQVLMRNINQLLYRVFNSRQVHKYCDLDIFSTSK